MRLPIPSQLVSLFKRSISAVFWAVLILIIIGELWVVKGSVDIILGTRQEVTVAQSRLIRINFGVYDQILKQLQNTDTYVPVPPTVTNPLGQSPKSVPQ